MNLHTEKLAPFFTRRRFFCRWMCNLLYCKRLQFHSDDLSVMTDKHKVSTQLIGEDVVAIEVAAAHQEAAAALDVEELVELLDTVDADDDKIFNQDWQQLDLDDLQLQTLSRIGRLSPRPSCKVIDMVSKQMNLSRSCVIDFFVKFQHLTSGNSNTTSNNSNKKTEKTFLCV